MVWQPANAWFLAIFDDLCSGFTINKMKRKVFFTLTLALATAPWMVNAQVTTLTFNFSQAPLLTADAGADSLICAGQPTTLGGSPSANGGTGPFVYAWTPITDLSDPTFGNPVATPTDTTTYTLSVTDANGCTASSSLTLFVDICESTEMPGLGSVVLYPNPNNGSFQLNANLVKQVESFNLIIMDVAGKEVYRSSKQNPEMLFNQQVSLPKITRGIYIVKMDFDGAVVERKIIVQ